MARVRRWIISPARPPRRRSATHVIAGVAVAVPPRPPHRPRGTPRPPRPGRSPSGRTAATSRQRARAARPGGRRCTTRMRRPGDCRQSEKDPQSGDQQDDHGGHPDRQPYFGGGDGSGHRAGDHPGDQGQPHRGPGRLGREGHDQIGTSRDSGRFAADETGIDGDAGSSGPAVPTAPTPTAPAPTPTAPTLSAPPSPAPPVRLCCPRRRPRRCPRRRPRRRRTGMRARTRQTMMAARETRRATSTRFWGCQVSTTDRVPSWTAPPSDDGSRSQPLAKPSTRVGAPRLPPPTTDAFQPALMLSPRTR